MFGNITFGGLASGLDAGSIITQLLAVERLPIKLLQGQKSTEESKLSLIGTFKGLIESLQEKADALKSPSAFLDFSVSASFEGVANFTTTGLAVEGSHSLEIQSLAAADIWAFDGVLDPDTDLGSADGEMVSFSVNGTTYEVSFDQASSSLYDIASKINGVAGDDVTANVVNVGTESNPSYQLVLSSDDTGEDLRITGISSTVTGLTIDGTAPDVDGNPQSANNVVVGSNAVAIIDGLTVERQGNLFGGVIQGVTIDALSTNVGDPISFTVGADQELIKEKIQDLIDAYNEVNSFINKQNTYTEDDGPGGDLFGDTLLRSVRRSIDSALFGVDIATVTADTEGYSTLSLIGIEKANDGTLSINESVFDDKLAENVDAVMDLFADSDGFDNNGAVENTLEYYQDTTLDSGLADTLSRVIDRMFGTFNAGGTVLKNLFDSRTDSLNENIKRIESQIENKERYIELFEERLVLRFARLEELMGGLNAQGDTLNSMLASLNG